MILCFFLELITNPLLPVLKVVLSLVISSANVCHSRSARRFVVDSSYWDSEWADNQ